MAIWLSRHILLQFLVEAIAEHAGGIAGAMFATPGGKAISFADWPTLLSATAVIADLFSGAVGVFRSSGAQGFRLDPILALRYSDSHAHGRRAQTRGLPMEFGIFVATRSTTGSSRSTAMADRA